MKWFRAFEVRRIELACAATLALISIYYAGTTALAPEIRYIRQAYLAKSNNPVETRPAEVACHLPDGWQADWRGEVLWITHYNQDGAVADALPFHSLEGLYDWVEDHPDFCDVNVEKSDASKCATTQRPGECKGVEN